MSKVTAAIASMAILVLVGLSLAQWQQFPQNDRRVGPVYPRGPYRFSQRSFAGDPYRFDWNSGAWGFAPGGPYGTGAPGGGYQYTYSNGAWQYAPTPPNAAQPNTPQPNPPLQPNGNPAAPGDNAPAPTPTDDSELWSNPSTQPAGASSAPRPTVNFSGQIVSIKAVDLIGEPHPHVLLRLLNANGASGTIDVSTRLQIPPMQSEGEAISATGKMGDIDGSLVLFADQIAFGKVTVQINRAMP